MIERFLLLGAVAIAVVAAVTVVRFVVARRTRRLLAASSRPLWNALGEQPDGRATVVAFSTPTCAACRTAQVPALEALRRRLGEEAVRIFRVDVASKPDVARAFGVLTVPSTVVLAPSGRVAAVNHGFAEAERLVRQVALAG